MMQSAWDRSERAAFLATVPLFDGLQPDALHQLAVRCYVRSYPEGAFVFLEGDPADTIHLLASGRIKVVRELEDGREVILRLIHPREIFGAAGGWGSAVYPATAIAIEDAIVLRLPVAGFADLIAASPDFALAIIRELGQRLRDAERRIQDLQTQQVERRIARALLQLANKTGVRTAEGIELGLPLSRQDLAELTGTTLSTASRVVRAWHRRGLVKAGYQRVTILKPHQLFMIAEDLEDRQPYGSSGSDRTTAP